MSPESIYPRDQLMQFKLSLDVSIHSDISDTIVMMTAFRGDDIVARTEITFPDGTTPGPEAIATEVAFMLKDITTRFQAAILDGTVSRKAAERRRGISGDSIEIDFDE